MQRCVHLLPEPLRRFLVPPVDADALLRLFLVLSLSECRHFLLPVGVGLGTSRLLPPVLFLAVCLERAIVEMSEI